MRGKVAIETLRRDREAIIITEIPYQVNKATMVERIAELVREKKIEGIAELRDESDRDGYRVVIELKRDAMADVVLNQLYRFTPLQTLVRRQHGGARRRPSAGDEPEGPADRPSSRSARRWSPGAPSSCLNKARDRAHILVGLAIAVANIDEVIRHDPRLEGRQRGARSADGARLAGAGRRRADRADRRSAPQASRPTAPTGCPTSRPRRSSICACSASPRSAATRSRTSSTSSPPRSPTISTSCARARASRRSSRTSCAQVKKDFATPRRTADRRAGRRGRGRGPDPARGHGRHRLASRLRQARAALDLSGAAARRQGPLRHADARRGFRHPAVRRLTHTPVLFFSSHGRVYKEKVWRLPLAAPQARGKALINILPLEQGERSPPSCRCPRTRATWDKLDVMFATTRGTVRRNKLSDFVDVRRSGIIAMKLDEGDGIVDVQICTEKDDVLLTTAGGQCIRFPVTGRARVPGPHLDGRARHHLDEGDKVISLSILRHVEATRRGARRLSQARQRGAARRTARPRRARPTPRRPAAARSSSASSAMSRCRRPSSSC